MLVRCRRSTVDYQRWYNVGKQLAQPYSYCGQSNLPTVDVQGLSSAYSTLIINTVKYQFLYKVDSTLVYSKKSVLIVKSGFFQNASIEIKKISFVYKRNRFTVIVVLMIIDLILAFVKVELMYISNIYIR